MPTGLAFRDGALYVIAVHELCSLAGYFSVVSRCAASETSGMAIGPADVRKYAPVFRARVQDLA